MRLSSRFAVLPFLLLAAAVHADREITVGSWQLQDTAKVSARGDVVSRPGYQAERWYPAVVPGTVLTSLVADGVYPEPLYGLNNLTIPESLCRTSYWYRTTVPIPKSYAGRHIWLNFEGISYRAHVWVNGRLVGDINGAFARGQFDISLGVTPGEKAGIAVEILPPPHPSVPLEQSLAAGTGRNGGAMGADGPAFVATVGWDWIPGIRDRDMGIWQNVTLSATGDVSIQDPFVKTTLPLPNRDSAALNIQTGLHNPTAQSQSGTLIGEVEKTNISFRIPVQLAPGETKTVSTDPQTINNPRLWWPNTYGKPDMYRLHLRFEKDGKTSDEQSTNFGVRTISYFLPGGKNLTVIVNGVPIMCKGGNWGMDEAMKRSPLKRLDAQLRIHRDANCTMVRNWVGMATQEDFYAMCDKYGMLIWDDFWLANPADGPVPEDPALFLANAREKIVRYRNHPSIAVWCGRNEGDPPIAIETGLAKLTTELDGTRFYQKHSSAYNGVGGGGPYALRNLTSYFTFNDALHTEIGAPSIPTLEAIKAMMPEKDWWPINDDWAYHDLLRGAQQGDRFPDVVAQRYGAVSGLPDFVRKSQLVNYEAYRAIFEGRNSKLFNPATGVLLWMSNPSQPSFVWQLYSYDLEPNGALFGTQKACEAIHIQMDPRDGKIQVINNTPDAIKNATVFAAIYNLDGSQRALQMKSLSAAPSAATDALTLNIPSGVSDVYFVRLELRQGRKPLSDNFYWRSQAGESSGYMPNDFRVMQSMPEAGLNVATGYNRSHGVTRVAVKLTNPGKSVALMTHLQLRKATGERVLPVFYSENYISLLPGESRNVVVEAATADAGAKPPVLMVDGWNVSLNNTNGPVEVRLNSDAQSRRALPEVSSSATNPPGVFRNLNTGGSTIASFVSDENFAEGGFTRPRPGSIDVTTAGEKAVDPDVYQTERSGECTFTIPVRAGQTYTVRLHFADTVSDAPSLRIFNVDLNGKAILSNFDIFKEVGGRGRVLVKDFPSITPDSRGNIVVALRTGTIGQPEIRAIQVLNSQRLGQDRIPSPLT